MPQKKMTTLVAWLIVAMGIGLALWKCQYGFDPLDDAFSLPHGFKLFALGDRPIIDEIRNGPRQHDLLNHYLVRPWLPYSVLALRCASVIFFAVSLLLLAWVTTKRNFSPTIALAVVAFLGFDFLASPSWSYNQWNRNFAIMQALLLFLADGTDSRLRRRAYLAGAGLAMGGMIFAYHTMALAMLAAIVVIPVACRRNGERSATEWLGFYLAGASLILVPYAVYFFRPDVNAAWMDHMRTMTAERWYQNNSSFWKFFLMLAYLGTRVEFYALLFMGLWIGIRQTFTQRMAIGCAVVIVGNFCYRAGTSDIHLYQWALATSIAFAIAGAITLLFQGWNNRNVFSLILPGIFLPAVFVTGMSSEGANGALYWLSPALAIPFLARLDSAISPLPAKHLVTGLMLLLVGASTHHQLRQTYGDASVKNCSAKINVPPLVGIRTTARKQRIYEALFSISVGRQFLLTYDALPAAFLFTNARSSIDTISTILDVPDDSHRRSFAYMIEQRRLPDAIVKVKIHARTWGAEQIPVHYEKNEPYDQFTNCAKGASIVSLPELEAFEVNRNRVELCARRHFVKTPERSLSSEE